MTTTTRTGAEQLCAAELTDRRVRSRIALEERVAALIRLVTEQRQ